MVAPISTMPKGYSITADNPLLFNHHWKQARYELSQARINYICKGRRSGGTQIAKRRCIRFAMTNSQWGDWRAILCAPTYQQAKDIWWNDIKKMLHKKWWEDTKVIKDKSESELFIKLINGSIIKVIGLDKPDRAEGAPINHAFVSEAPNCKKEAIMQHIMPMLSERLGGIDAEAAPEGRNWFYKECCKAQEIEYEEMEYHTWTSAEVMPLYLGEQRAAAELEAARDRMDAQIFQQEYEAAFIHFENKAYYNFDRKTHAIKPVYYDPEAPLHLAFDFNVEPGVCIAIQEGIEQKKAETPVDCTYVVSDITIPKNSTTLAICNKIRSDYGDHKGTVFLYGDSTGGARGSAKLQGSDWDIIKNELKKSFGIKIYNRVGRSNPRERDRVNAVNCRLRNAAGEVRTQVDPRKARFLAEDLDETVTLKGGAGEIDKKVNPERTHHTDAFGYYIEKQFPVTSGNRAFSMGF